MHAIRQHEFGPPSVLRYEELVEPVPGDGQVVIEVAAAGVHVLDTMIRSGATGGPFPLPELPMTPGREVAGVVTAASDDAWMGRRVVAHLGQASGGYAQRAIATTSALHDIGSLDPAVAVAMIGTGRTATALLEAAAIRPDDVVLVTSAAGGMGNLLVQAALRAGAGVVGLAGGAEKVARVRGLGALAVDYRLAAWSNQVRAVLDGKSPTLLIDAWGGIAGDTAATLLGPGGRLVRFGGAGSVPAGVRTTVVTGQQIMQRPGGMRGLEIAALRAAARAEWTPLVQRFPLADAAPAQAAIEGRLTSGKVVLVP